MSLSASADVLSSVIACWGVLSPEFQGCQDLGKSADSAVVDDIQGGKKVCLNGEILLGSMGHYIWGFGMHDIIARVQGHLVVAIGIRLKLGDLFALRVQNGQSRLIGFIGAGITDIFHRAGRANGHMPFHAAGRGWR